MQISKLIFNSIAVFITYGSMMCHAASWEAVIAAQNDGLNGLVDIFDINANAVLPQSPILVGTNAVYAGITPNGVTAYIAGNTFNNVDIPSATAGAAFLPIDADVIAISPDGTSAYLLKALQNILYKVDLINNTFISTIINLNDPVDVIVSPDGTKVFVSNSLGNNISIYDAATLIPDPQSIITPRPKFLGITPDGTNLLATSFDNNNIDIFNTTTFLLDNTIILPATEKAVAKFVISSDGIFVYAPATPDHILTRVYSGTIATAAVAPPIEIASTDFTTSIAITPDGNSLFLTNSIGTLYKITDITTSPIITSSTVPGSPLDIEITPDQAPTASFIIASVTSGLATFDASASSSPVGTIANYNWDFGDGSPTVNTSNPVIQHQYAISGSYSATLTVTNTGGTSTFQTFTGKIVSNNGGPSAVTTQSVQVGTINAPTNFHGKQIKNRFLTQTEFVNVLTWKPATSSEPAVFYSIFRNSAFTDLVAVVSGNQFKFEDHNRRKGVSYTYFIVAVNAAGDFSTPLSVTVNPKKSSN